MSFLLLVKMDWTWKKLFSIMSQFIWMVLHSFEATSYWTAVKHEIMLEEFWASKSCCSALCQIGIPSQNDSLFFCDCLNHCSTWGSLQRREKLSLKSIWKSTFSWVWFCSPVIPLYRTVLIWLAMPITKWLFFFLDWHPFKMNRKNIETLQREWLFLKIQKVYFYKYNILKQD